jgi:TonB family protein
MRRFCADAGESARPKLESPTSESVRDGTVGDTKVVKSVLGFDQAAIDAVRQWKFKPAMAKGKPVAVWVAVPVRFTVH